MVVKTSVFLCVSIFVPAILVPREAASASFKLSKTTFRMVHAMQIVAAFHVWNLEHSGTQKRLTGLSSPWLALMTFTMWKPKSHGLSSFSSTRWLLWDYLSQLPILGHLAPANSTPCVVEEILAAGRGLLLAIPCMPLAWDDSKASSDEELGMVCGIADPETQTCGIPCSAQGPSLLQLGPFGFPTAPDGCVEGWGVCSEHDWDGPGATGLQ